MGFNLRNGGSIKDMGRSGDVEILCEKAAELRNNIHEGSCWPVAGSPISVAVRRVKLWRVDRGKDHFFSFSPPRKTLQFYCEASHFNVESKTKHFRRIYWLHSGHPVCVCRAYWGGTFCGQEVPLHRVSWWNSFEPWKKNWLFRVYRGLYSPVI